MGRAPADLAELVDNWTVLADEQELVAGKRGATRLGFALLLKFYSLHARFPRGRFELPEDVVEFVARQVQVEPTLFDLYEWAGRTIEFHRQQIRRHLGFRECGVVDAEKLTIWLAQHVTERERRPERVRDELVRRCRVERVEPPTSGRIDRMVRSALHAGEEALTSRVSARLGEDATGRINALIINEPTAESFEGDTDETASEGGDANVLTSIKQAPGNVSLETVLTEIDKLLAVRAIGLPAGIFGDIAPQVVASWRERAAVESPSHLRTHPEPLRLSLLAALVHERQREITDTLVDLLITTVHRVGARAERKVNNELINAFKRVSGKENILFKVAEASLAEPEGTVRQVVFPAVSGGEQTLRELVQEFKTKGSTYRRTVQTTLKASYTNHYRRGLIRLLDVLEFRSSNTVHQPVIEALALIRRFTGAGNITYYPPGEKIPAHRGVTGDWEEVVYKADTHGKRRVVRMAYEVATFQVLRDQLRCKEIWVVGADRWRDPDKDLPADFDERRAEHYGSLRKPLDPSAFVDEMREEMRTELSELNDALPGLDWLSIAERRSGAIKLSPQEAQTEPRNLRRVKDEVLRRWGTVPLVDMLKEAVLRTGCLSVVTSVTPGGSIAPPVLAERLLLAIYAYGTNAGIRAVAAGDHDHNEDDIRYVRRRYLTVETARSIAIEIANATFAVRSQALWGAGSTAVASDSTHVRALDQNIFTEWHSRYGTGVRTGSPAEGLAA